MFVHLSGTQRADKKPCVCAPRRATSNVVCIGGVCTLSSLFTHVETLVTGRRLARGHWKWLLPLAALLLVSAVSLCGELGNVLEMCSALPHSFQRPTSGSSTPCCNVTAQLPQYLPGPRAESCLFSGKRTHRGDCSNPNRDLSGEAGRAEAGEIRHCRLLKAASELASCSLQNSPSNSRGNL